MVRSESIVAVCCQNSALKVAESLGKHPVMKSVQVVKVPCSGNVEVGFILKCLEKGCAGVLVLGCPLDNCQYITGNCRAQKRVAAAKQALWEAGVRENRVDVKFISSLDAHTFRQAIHEMRKSLLAGREDT